MPRPNLLPLLLAAGCIFSAPVVHAKQETVFVCYGSDGSVSIGSAPTTGNCEQVASEVPAAPPQAQTAGVAAGAHGGTAAGTATSDAASGGSESTVTASGQDVPPLETRLANYRDIMVQGASGAKDVPPAAANRAVNRRYRMIDRNTYMSSRRQ